MPGRLVLADLTFKGWHIYYFDVWTPINTKGRRLLLSIHSFIILGTEIRISALLLQGNQNFGLHWIFGPPWKFFYFGIFALLGFTLGIRVSGISSWYFLLGLRV